MLLTKEYFKKRQNLILLACVLAATIVGSIQTACIVYKLNKGE
jgi:hypothetical protein